MRDVLSRIAKLEMAKLEAARDARYEADPIPRVRQPWWPDHWRGCPAWKGGADQAALEGWQSRQYAGHVALLWLRGELPVGEFPDDSMPWATSKDRQAAAGFWRAVEAVREGLERREALEGRPAASPQPRPAHWPKNFPDCPAGSDLAAHQAHHFSVWVTRLWQNKELPVGSWPPGPWADADREMANKIWSLRAAQDQQALEGRWRGR
jgi:hypothetical protein